MQHSTTRLQWDIFCKVIDNFGDIGVSWRLAASLASSGQQVRLWTDDASALAWMAPHGCEGVEVLAWPATLAAADLEKLERMPCNVMVEAFGCEIAPEFIASCALHIGATVPKPLWINLEYLSAEAYVERCHTLPSLVSSGPGTGWTKWFFYPGFNPKTGGLLRESALLPRQNAFERASWLARQAIDAGDRALVSLFCYEPPALQRLLRQFAVHGLAGRPVQLLVAHGRPALAVKAALQMLDPQTPEWPVAAAIGAPSSKYDEIDLWRNSQADSLLSVSYLPLLTQLEFDELLWACELNFVRGEDSVVRAIWAGKPFVWQLYPQDDGAHSAKLEAFLNVMAATPAVRTLHHLWNGSLARRGDTAADASPRMATKLVLPSTGSELAEWQQQVQAMRSSLMQQADLTVNLIEFASKNR